MITSRGVSDDLEQLAAWRAGDAAAGEALFERYFEPLCRFFRAKLGDDVQDLIQQTMLACLEGREQIRGDSFRAYLFAIARRRLFDHLRAAYRAELASLGSQSLAHLGTSPSTHVGRNERHALLLAAMAELPLDFQITLELHYWEELSGAEIATVLEISENTVRSRLARAREQLREELAELSRRPA
jgi:RNA polymerase sigma-70 factor (ECF subfamily)